MHACEHRQMCPNLANQHYTATAVSKNLYVAAFGPFLESDSGDGASACVTVHIALYREKLDSHTSRHLTLGFRYSVHIQVVAGMFIRSAIPCTTSATCAVPAGNVSAPVVSRFKSESFLTTINHSSDCYNVSRFRRAGETVVM